MTDFTREILRQPCKCYRQSCGLLVRLAASFGRLIWLAAINMLSSVHSSWAPFQRQLGISLRKRRAMNKIVVSSAVGIAVCSLFAGCASIINGRNADVAID